MRGEQRLGSDLAVYMFDDGPGEREPIVGRSAATDFVEDNQAARGRTVKRTTTNQRRTGTAPSADAAGTADKTGVASGPGQPFYAEGSEDKAVAKKLLGSVLMSTAQGQRNRSPAADTARRVGEIFLQHLRTAGGTSPIPLRLDTFRDRQEGNPNSWLTRGATYAAVAATAGEAAAAPAGEQASAANAGNRGSSPRRRLSLCLDSPLPSDRRRRRLGATPPFGQQATSSSPYPSAAQAATTGLSADSTSVETPVYDERRLAAGISLTGPAIVESPFTTVVVPPGATLSVDPYRNLVIRP